MKLLVAATALACASAKLSQPEERNLQVTSCFINGKFHFNPITDQGCSYELLRAEMENKINNTAKCTNTADDELVAIFGADVETLIETKCQEAYDAKRDALDFGTFTNKGDQFDKEYFDGGTYMNEEREDNAGNYNLQSDFTRIKLFYDNGASAKSASFPDDLTNFDNCEIGASFCCWSADRQAGDNNGNCATPYDTNCVDADPGDNTDVCSVDISRFPEAARIPTGVLNLPGDSEGAIHCHGLAWSPDANHSSQYYSGNNLFYVSMYDHFYQRGYVRNVPGAPMCGCAEKMPIVSRADCTEVQANETIKFFYDNTTGAGTFLVVLVRADLQFNACEGVDNNNNDLEAYYKRLVEEGERTEAELAVLQQTIVGTCDA